MEQQAVTVIVETPKGSSSKFDFDPELGCYKLNKVMPAGLVFPFDFGFIPGTTGGDGDPVDALVISELQTFPGAAIDCKIIGAIKASQRERDGEKMRNDRIIAVPNVSAQYGSVKELKDLPKTLVLELESFFANYNSQAGKMFIPLERLNARKAFDLLNEARDNDHKDFLVQLFIPLYDPKGKAFPKSYYSDLNSRLKDKFGGLTAYTRTPATGIWKRDDQDTVRDELLVYEVLTGAVEESYWIGLKQRLALKFSQQEILITVTKTRKI